MVRDVSNEQLRRYGWAWFRDEIARGVQLSEARCTSILAHIQEMDAIVCDIVARPTSPFSDRPQDFVVSLLATRVFRLTVSALYIGLGGYHDSATGLTRTVWEIAIRLLDMTDSPEAAALGFLLDAASSEINHVDAELEHRQRSQLPSGNLANNLRMMRSHYDALAQVTITRDLDPKVIASRHGILNFRNVCERFGIGKAYRVNYAFQTGYVHEKASAATDYMIETPEGREFHLGPVGVPGGPQTVAIDVLTDAALALVTAARIIGDGELIQRTDNLLEALRRD